MDPTKGTKPKKELEELNKQPWYKRSLKKEITPTDITPDRTPHEQEMMDNCETIECDD